VKTCIGFLATAAVARNSRHVDAVKKRNEQYVMTTKFRYSFRERLLNDEKELHHMLHAKRQGHDGMAQASGGRGSAAVGAGSAARGRLIPTATCIRSQ
jgi:hypothetical protein